jgi:hypothetical protein
MKLFLVVVVLGIGAILGAYVFGWGKYTNCYADFQTAEAAERVASVARAAGFSADVEESGPLARRPSSLGARGISVILSDGETDADAATFRMIFERLVRAEDGRGKASQCRTESLLGLD